MTVKTRHVEHTEVQFDGTVSQLLAQLRDVHLRARIVDLEQLPPFTQHQAAMGTAPWVLRLEREVSE